MKPEDLASLSVNSDGVAVLRMHDETTGNGLSENMVHSLGFLLAEAANREDVRTLVVAGLPEYFSSGATQEVLLKLAESQIEPEDLILPRKILEVPVPTIAAMEGHAIGGGLALGICCDIVLIARESRYGFPFMNFGFTPGMGTTRLLEHVVSPALAHEMLFTGQTFKGSRLEGCSGFNHVTSKNQLWPKALDIAARIAEKPRSSLILLKKDLVSGRQRLYEEARKSEAQMHRETFANPEVIVRIRESFSSPR